MSLEYSNPVVRPTKFTLTNKKKIVDISPSCLFSLMAVEIFLSKKLPTAHILLSVSVS